MSRVFKTIACTNTVVHTQTHTQIHTTTHNNKEYTKEMNFKNIYFIQHVTKYEKLYYN